MNNQIKEVEQWSGELRRDTIKVLKKKPDTIFYFQREELGNGYIRTFGEYHYSNDFIITIRTLEKHDSIISAIIQPHPYVYKLNTKFETRNIWNKFGFKSNKNGDLKEIKYRYKNSFLIESAYNQEIYDSDFENYLTAFGMDKVFSPGGMNLGRGFEESRSNLESTLDSSEIALLMRSINPIGRIMGYHLSKKYQSKEFIQLKNSLEWDTTQVNILNGCLGSRAILNELLPK